MKMLSRISALAVLAVLLLIVGGWVRYTNEVDLDTKVVSLTIASGTGFGAVASQLESEGVVGSSTMLKIAARLNGVDRKLTPGRYDFTGSNSCRSVLDKLAKADFLRIKVTVPEGSTIWQTASILAKGMGVDSGAIVALNSNAEFLESRNLPYLEGYLFPETYFFAWGSSVEQMVDEMLERFRTTTDSVWPGQLPNGLSIEEVVILASIVEAEARKDDERAIIASVYTNRTLKPMKLDADPTVIYGLGGVDRKLWSNDLKRDTPYNTYLHVGFPPTPINSPGLASIKATLNPAETDYLFFVADDSGGHYFSRTLTEHNRARERIRQSRNNGR